jgi:hypothetical protein
MPHAAHFLVFLKLPLRWVYPAEYFCKFVETGGNADARESISNPCDKNARSCIRMRRNSYSPVTRQYWFGRRGQQPIHDRKKCKVANNHIWTFVHYMLYSPKRWKLSLSLFENQMHRYWLSAFVGQPGALPLRAE